MNIKIESSEKDFQEMLMKRQHEKMKKELDEKQKTTHKVLRLQLLYLAVEGVTLIIGYGLIFYQLGFLVGLGIWFIFWSNNLSILRNLYKDSHKLIKELWSYGI